MVVGWCCSKISPTYPWKIPRTLHQQFLMEFLSLWGFGEVWGYLPRVCGQNHWVVLLFNGNLRAPSPNQALLRDYGTMVVSNFLWSGIYYFTATRYIAILSYVFSSVISSQRFVFLEFWFAGGVMTCSDFVETTVDETTLLVSRSTLKKWPLQKECNSSSSQYFSGDMLVFGSVRVNLFKTSTRGMYTHHKWCQA